MAGFFPSRKHALPSRRLLSHHGDLACLLGCQESQIVGTNKVFHRLHWPLDPRKHSTAGRCSGQSVVVYARHRPPATSRFAISIRAILIKAFFKGCRLEFRQKASVRVAPWLASRWHRVNTVWKPELSPRRSSHPNYMTWDARNPKPESRPPQPTALNPKHPKTRGANIGSSPSHL